MADIQVSKSIRKITKIVKPAAEGKRAAEVGRSRKITVYRKSEKRRRVSRSLKPAEEHSRALAEAIRTFTDEYLARHTRSNSRRRDGWLWDRPENVYRAYGKAVRKYWDLLDEDKDEDDEDEDDD
jgi:hypothetical protein